MAFHKRTEPVASQQPIRSAHLGARLARTAGWDRVRSVLPEGAASVSPEHMLLGGSATFNAQIWLSQFPLRPTAGWAAVAALLAAGAGMRPLALDWPAVALLLLLADPLWGGIWRLAAGRLEMLPLQAPSRPRMVWLPYLEPGSPAARLLGWDDQGVLHLVLRVVAPTVAIALGIALVLGPTAVWLTLLITLLSAGGWIARHSIGYFPAALHSAVTVALPWWLALDLAGVTPAHDLWMAHQALIGVWFVHNWGEGRCLRQNGDRIGIALLAVADVALAVLLVAARAPLWLALIAVLWMPTWILVYQRRPLTRLNFWWLIAMLLSGVALGQSG